MYKAYHLAGCIALLFVFSNVSLAQSVSNIRARVVGKQVKITYDLIESEPGQLVRIKLKSSKDNYQLQLVQVSGTGVGEDVIPGRDKEIIWYPENELGYRGFTGSLLFKIAGEVTYAPFKIINPLSKTKQKRGKKLTMVYSGGKSGEMVKVDLLKNGSVIKTFGESPNERETKGIPKKYLALGDRNKFKQLKIPAGGIKKGRYQVKITSVQKPDNNVISDPFLIKKKTPWIIRKIPIIALLGGAYYGYDTYLNVEPEETDLPESPGTPN